MSPLCSPNSLDDSLSGLANFPAIFENDITNPL